MVGALLILSLLVMMWSAYVATPLDYEPVRIDGDFADWAAEPIHGDETGWQEITTQLRHYWAFHTPTWGANERMDAFRFWVDVDGDVNTGLLIGGIGADLRLVLQFWKGQTKDAALCAWQSQAESWQYTEFDGCTGILAASSAGRVEFALLTWTVGNSPRWVAESVPVVEERQTFHHGASKTFWTEPAASHVWRDYIQASGTTEEWPWLRQNNLTETYPSNTTGVGRLKINTVTARVTPWNTSLLLDLRADPLPIPFSWSNPPSGEKANTSAAAPPYQLKPPPPDQRDRLLITAADRNESVAVWLWQGQVMEVSATNGSAWAAGIPAALEVQVTRSWANGAILLLEPAKPLHEGDPREPKDAFYAPIHILSTPAPEPMDISGNYVYWFRDTAHATETDCTSTNDKQATATQGAGAVKTITLTTGQNACWYVDASTGITTIAGSWETLLDIQTSGDNGGTGNGVGMVAYRSNTGSCASAAVNCPKVKYWSGSVWSTEEELATAGGGVENVRVEWDPAMSYKHWIAVNAAGTITVYYCTDTTTGACSSLGTATTQTVGTAPERHWDISMEQSSGDGLLVYDNPAAAANDLCYRTFTTTLSSETCFDHTWVNSTNPSFEYVQLRSNPGSNNIALFAADTTNDDAILGMWDGSAWLTGDDMRAATLAYTLTKSYPGAVYAEDSANEFVAYSGDGASNMNVCEWTSAAGWEYDNGVTVTCAAFDPNPSANNDVRTMSTGYAYQIGTNRALVGQNDDTNDIDIWNWEGVAGAGGAVETNQEPSSTDCSIVARCYDFAWNFQSAQVDNTVDGAVFLYDGVDARCEYRTYNDATDAWTGTGTFEACTGSSSWFTAIQQPWGSATDAAIILRSNSNNDILSHQWDGNFAAAGGANHVLTETSITADATDQAYPYFDFAWGPRPVEYDVRLEIWDKPTDAVKSTVGTCLNVVTRGDDVQCLISGVASIVLDSDDVVRIKIAHSSAAGSVLVDYDDSDSTGNSRATIPLPELEQVLFVAFPLGTLVLIAVWRRK